jgi:hypothetical protein
MKKKYLYFLSIVMFFVFISMSISLILNDYSNMTVWGYIKVACAILAIISTIFYAIAMLLMIKKSGCE